MARVALPLAWVTSSLPSYGCTWYGASSIAFGLVEFFFVIIWLYLVWREYYCLRPGLPHLCHRMAVHCMAPVLLPLAWVDSSLLSYGCTLHGAGIIAFGLCNLILAILWLYIVWRQYHCLWSGLIHLCYHIAVCCLVRVLLPLAWVTACLPLYGGTLYGASIIPSGQANSSLLSYGWTPFGTSIIAFDLV